MEWTSSKLNNESITVKIMSRPSVFDHVLLMMYDIFILNLIHAFGFPVQIDFISQTGCSKCTIFSMFVHIIAVSLRCYSKLLTYEWRQF